MGQDDLVQQGFLGALTVTEQTKETTERRLKRQIIAAKCEVIDSLRAFHDNRCTLYGRQRERLVPDIVHLADLRQDIAGYEETRTRYRELLDLAAGLSQRNQAILWARLRGYTLLEVADMLHVSEVRVYQLQQQIVAYLRKKQHEP